MPRSLLREDQIRDADVLTETEHNTEVLHYFNNLVDVTTYSGHAGEYVVANASGTGLEFSSGTSGKVEELYYNDTLIVSTASDGAKVNDSSAFYFGDPTVSGTWRIIRSNDDLAFQRRENDTWVDKFKFTAQEESFLRIG
jgi:hypothetical protein